MSEEWRTPVTQKDWDRAQNALRDALAYVKSRTPPLSTNGTDIALQRIIEAAICERVQV